MKKPLQKIVTGGLVLSTAFFVSAAIESQINASESATIASDQLQIFVLNSVQGCQIQTTVTNLSEKNKGNIIDNEK